ncbi:MAG: hypothetical protein KDA69_19720, partial [Planctomycetaceae bacterium]|nr:hypothetical protein [Planctomycetaceae bacterium]
MNRQNDFPEQFTDFCPHCDCFYKPNEFQYLGMVAELGNVYRFRCNRCSQTFETLPPSFPFNPNDFGG